MNFLFLFVLLVTFTLYKTVVHYKYYVFESRGCVTILILDVFLVDVNCQTVNWKPLVYLLQMGYGKFDQKGTGLHLRQWARSYIIGDGDKTIVFVNVDVAMIGDGVRIQVGGRKVIRLPIGRRLYFFQSSLKPEIVMWNDENVRFVFSGVLELQFTTFILRFSLNYL